MGDEITLTGVEFIQDGVIQMDFRNETTGKTDRCFINAQQFFTMLGESMQKQHTAYMARQGFELEGK